MSRILLRSERQHGGSGSAFASPTAVGRLVFASALVGLACVHLVVALFS